MAKWQILPCGVLAAGAVRLDVADVSRSFCCLHRAPASRDGALKYLVSLWMLSLFWPELNNHFSWELGWGYGCGLSVCRTIQHKMQNAASRGCFLQVGGKPAAPTPWAPGGQGRRKVPRTGGKGGGGNKITTETGFGFCFLQVEEAV